MAEQPITPQRCLEYANELNLRIQDLEIKQQDYGLTGKELLELREARVMRNWHEAYAQRLMNKQQ